MWRREWKKKIEIGKNVAKKKITPIVQYQAFVWKCKQTRKVVNILKVASIK